MFRSAIAALCAAFVAVPLAAQDNSVPTVAGADRHAQVASGAALVSSADARASEAGREMLAAGGSAADAALATMLTLTVVEPQSSGIGGGGFFVYHDAASGEIVTIDGRETAPAAAQPGRFLGNTGEPRPFAGVVPGGLSVGVPGNIALAAEAHRRFGKLPWAQLFEPAIRLAEDGYEVSAWLASALASHDPGWDNFPGTRALYSIDGRLARRGEILRNPELAALLREVAAGGPDAFYAGTTARAIVGAVRGAAVNPGDMTEGDLAAYRAREREPVCVAYRVYRLCGMGPPSAGATTVFAIMGMLEGFDLKTMGRDNVMSWHVIAEAMRLAYADRDAYVADPAFSRVPVHGLLDADYLASRAALIRPERSMGRAEPGVPPGLNEPHGAQSAIEHPATTHLVVADREGNAVSMTTSIEFVFGSKIFVNGYLLNNQMTDFSLEPVDAAGRPVANRVEAGKRPRSSMSPMLVFKDERPVLAVGAPGGSAIINYVAKTLVGALLWGMDIQAAIELPNMGSRNRATEIERGTKLTATAATLKAMGHEVREVDFPSGLHGVMWTPDGLEGGADPRREGHAMGG